MDTQVQQNDVYFIPELPQNKLNNFWDCVYPPKL